MGVVWILPLIFLLLSILHKHSFGITEYPSFYEWLYNYSRHTDILKSGTSQWLGEFYLHKKSCLHYSKKGLERMFIFLIRQLFSLSYVVVEMPSTPASCFIWLPSMQYFSKITSLYPCRVARTQRTRTVSCDVTGLNEEWANVWNFLYMKRMWNSVFLLDEEGRELIKKVCEFSWVIFVCVCCFF